MRAIRLKYSLLITVAICNLCCLAQVDRTNIISYDDNFVDSKYKVQLFRTHISNYFEFDTIVSLKYLISDSGCYKGTSNFDRFIKLNYPKLNIKQTKYETFLFNDSIKITLQAKPFDTIQFRKNIQNDSQYYFKHPFYGIDETYNSIINTLALPTYELSSIQFQINGFSIPIHQSTYENFYDPNVFWDNPNNINVSVNGYITENGEIILTMFNSRGDGSAYIAIFIFDNKRKLKGRIVQPL